MLSGYLGDGDVTGVEIEMSGRTVGLVFAAALLAFFAFALWYQRQHPREIVGTGQVTVEKNRPGGVTRVTLRTRTISINGRRFQEVELPGGTWIDCAGDCRKAVFDTGDGFWQKIERERGGR
jgi:hypothetical protein